MERLTKKDGANRNIIEVKRYSDEDWIIVENTKYRTISFHSKAIDKLAEFEDFMEEMNFESLEDICEVLVKFKKNINVIYQLKQENQALKDRWEKLREFINEKLETSKGAEWYAVEEIDCEMQELEKEMRNVQ